jgi:peptidase E
MTSQPGLIILLGSGETSATIRKVYHWLFERLETTINIGLLETPAGFEPNSAMVAEQIAEFFSLRLQNFQPHTSIIPARKRGTPHSPDDPKILSPLLDTNVIMMGPGSPTYTVRQLQDSLAWQILTARHRLGIPLIFASAGTIAVSAQALPVYEIYKVGEDLHWKPGLNFFEVFGLSLIFIPHWNNNDGGLELDTSHCYMGTDRYNQLVGLLPRHQTIVGLDEHTALGIDPGQTTCRVMGKGKATIVRDGAERSFPTGQIFDLGELGPFGQLCYPGAGIPPEVWDRVLTAQAEARLREKEPVPPGPVIALLEKRSVARGQKDWLRADQFRDDIESLGWRVIDTPAGSHLKPL